ncbi:MAG: N-acetyl-gamma-glutamyl-phosphate reductase [Pseudomonadota bacterium]
MSQPIRVAVIGASGYTGADLVRLALRHPAIDIAALTANAHAGQPIGSVYPHLAHHGLPDLVTNADVDWRAVDAAFCGLPHATSAAVIADLPASVKVIDMSADFRLRDLDTYTAWYGEHSAPALLAGATYGLTEHYRSAIASSRLVACPGCYPTAALMALVPLLTGALVQHNDLIIDAKSGLTGAGRSLKQNTLGAEAGEGLSPYAVGTHRHAPEIEQELGVAAGGAVTVNFTPHLIPMSRGELVTCYAKLAEGATAADCEAALAARYADEPFVFMAPEGALPQTQFVRGSNRVMLAVRPDRIPGRVIVIAALDNLVKGSAGQALQNFNVMFDQVETTGLEQVALFP